jgi:hypothetical protein
MLLGNCYTYFYPLQVVLAATLNIEAQSQVQLQQDLDYELCNINYISSQNFSIQFGTGSVWFMPTWCRAANVLGTALFPAQFAKPYRFSKGAVISVKVRNDTSSSNTIDLQFVGLHTSE